MKTFTKIIMTAAIAMASLQAQTHMASARADVPFKFQVAGRDMPAGKYNVTRTATGAYIMEHAETRRGVLFQAPLRAVAKPGSGKLEFRCFSEACEIESVTFAGDPNTYRRAFPGNKRNAVAPTAASVRLSQD